MADSSALQEAYHIRVGYLHETWGDITLDAQGQPRFSGQEVTALRDLYQSVTVQSLYRGLTPARTLEQMAVRMSGPVWAVRIGKDGRPYGNGG